MITICRFKEPSAIIRTLTNKQELKNSSKQISLLLVTQCPSWHTVCGTLKYYKYQARAFGICRGLVAESWSRTVAFQLRKISLIMGTFS